MGVERAVKGQKTQLQDHAVQQHRIRVDLLIVTNNGILFAI
jgi:hypothetical protein